MCELYAVVSSVEMFCKGFCLGLLYNFKDIVNISLPEFGLANYGSSGNGHGVWEQSSSSPASTGASLG